MRSITWGQIKIYILSFPKNIFWIQTSLQSTLLCKNHTLSIVSNLNSKQVNFLPARTFITTRNAGGAYTPDLMGEKVVLVVGIPHLSLAPFIWEPELCTNHLFLPIVLDYLVSIYRMSCVFFVCFLQVENPKWSLFKRTA